MKHLALLSYLFFIPVVSADEPQPVKVYCFSADLEAGFKDESASYWCKELDKIGGKKKSLELVRDKSLASALVQYLGAEEIKTKSEATYLIGGYAWTPDESKFGARAVLSVGDFTKGFFCQGAGARGPSGVRRMVESWIRENREVILQKAKQK